MKNILSVILFTLLFTGVKAQFEIDAQIRPRYESRNGYSKLRDSNTTSANFISQRTRLGFGYTQDNLELKISFQDVHVWGDILPKTMDNGFMGLHEGWAKFNFNSNLFLKVGRQEIFYDNSRLLTSSNWNQVGFTHDALKFGYQTDIWQIETVLGYNSTDAVYGSSYFPGYSIYKVLNTLWISRKLDKFTFSLLNIADVRQKNDSTYVDYLRNTLGPIIGYKDAKLSVDLRSFYQSGKLQSGQDVSAYYLNAEMDYKWNGKFSFLVGFEIKSGNNALDSMENADHAFDILYGSRHAFNGLMDYFSIPSTTGNAGLIDLYLTAKVDISEKISMSCQYHNFSLQNNYLGSDNLPIKKQLGNEIDVTAKIKFSKVVTLDLAICSMFGTESLEIIKGGDHNLITTYGFAMLTIKPTIFKQ